ncbi:hypothetical protein T12_13586 [Trichinella patagoniensis]|uniref:Uncharacterized protein n=1 Tax=Trichinella patagoniensis TaxID=990121 RepID=A0A0V0Z222_9BILA|nr:hypothetical protein T12_13586 [Trichinella patagoniensis]
MFIRAGGISLISETAQLLETTAALSSGASDNGWQMPPLFKGADAAVDFWRLLSIVARTSLNSGLSAGGLSNKGGADRLSPTVALLMVDLVTILLFSGASLLDNDPSMLFTLTLDLLTFALLTFPLFSLFSLIPLFSTRSFECRSFKWDPDGISGFSGFLRVFAHRE